MSKEPVRICITGAAGRIGYALVPLFCNGDVLGKDQPIILHLLDIERAKGVLQGISMEIEDGAYPLVREVVPTTDLKEAFSDVQVAVLVGGFPRGPGMQRKDLLDKNSPIFIGQGKALSDYADKDCKVLVVANPANTNCLQLLKNCSKLPKENFTCLTRLDQNRATAQVARKLNVSIDKVSEIIIWGNHSNTQVPDLSRGKVQDATGAETLVTSSDKFDSKWAESEFTSTVQLRGAAVIDAQKASSALSAAKAISDHLHDWLLGAKGPVSMGVYSAGNPYGIDQDLVFSFPVLCVGAGKWKHQEGVVLSDSAMAALKNTEKELIEERSFL